MRQFAVAGSWSSAQISAADQVRFFARLDGHVPRSTRAYARRLLSSIVVRQRWGFSRYAAAAGFESYFKGGWRRTPTGYLVHEVARFERGRRTRDAGGAQRRQPLVRLRRRDAARRRRADLRSGPADALPRAVANHAGARGRRTAAPSRRARRRAPLRTDDLARRALRREGQPHRRAAARLLPRVGVAARPRGSRPRTRPATAAAQRSQPARLRRLQARPGDAGAGALGPRERPSRARGHLHRLAQPPQPGDRGGPHARART